MHPKSFKTLLALAASTLTANGAIVWQVGLDDNGWPQGGTGGGPNANFVQEAGINPPPGNPNNPAIDRQADDDYYFAGVYTTTIPGNVAQWGAYTPVGVVPSNEEAAEQAFAGTDNDLRYHFNLPSSLSATDRLTVTFDAVNLHTAGNADPRYGIEVYFNGVLVMPQVVIRPAQLDIDYTTQPFTLASVDARTGAGFDNIVYLKGINYNSTGGGNWMGIDYVRLDVQPIPEPSSAVIMMMAALGTLPALRRRRR